MSRRARESRSHSSDDEGAPSDEALLAGVAARDEDCMVTFIRRYQRRVFGLAVGIVNDRGAAEDVAQEVMLRVWRHAPVFDSRRGSVENWVLTITRNLSIDSLRRQRAVPTDPDVLVALARASLGPLVEDIVASRSTRAVIVRALDALSPGAVPGGDLRIALRPHRTGDQ